MQRGGADRKDPGPISVIGDEVNDLLTAERTGAHRDEHRDPLNRRVLQASLHLNISAKGGSIRRRRPKFHTFNLSVPDALTRRR